MKFSLYFAVSFLLLMDKMLNLVVYRCIGFVRRMSLPSTLPKKLILPYDE